MKMWAHAFIALVLILDTSAAAWSLDKVVDTSWLKDSATKWGYVGSMCGYQSLNGLIESYHFNNDKPTQLVKDSNYHAFATAQRCSGILTGWFGYANLRNKRVSKWKRIGRIVGGAAWGRNFMEWSYKYNKHGNPFDYTVEHNRHGIVYFGIRDGKITDLYIGTGPVTGPAVDMLFLSVGWLLLR